MLGKRSIREDEDRKDDPTMKCARTEGLLPPPPSPNRSFLAAAHRYAQDLNIQGLTELLQDDPARTTQLLASSDPTRRSICRMFEQVFTNKLPEDYLYYLGTDAMLPWKHLLAEALQRQWITSDDWAHDDDLMTVPLFADLPAYKEWLTEQLRTRPTLAVLSAVTFASGSLIEWAYQQNNVQLLEWCQHVRVGAVAATTTPKPLFSNAYWYNHDPITGNDPAEATAKWWRENVSKYLPGEMSGSPGGEDDQNDALAVVDAIRVNVAGTPENEIVDLTQEDS